ncbi:MarR family transcriptional regulator [Streptomyces sp. NPDC051219]|uniref:MarR family winged helix-turn-helix transcriptional regulator n=1 Tax=Streptomyces sp. NPDC051219 TaxID=3155283 RepID=UPI0034286A09
MEAQEVSRTSRQFKVGVWRGLMEVYTAVMGELERELELHHRLAVNEFDALVNIPPGGTRVRELTERVVLSQSATSRLVDRLERRGLVARESAVDDSRSVVIRLTDEGRKVIRAAIRTNAEVVERAFINHLTPQELVIIDAAFTRLRAEARYPC